MLIEKTIHEFLEEVASQSPAPGGGSVSALAGALAASLTSMVCRLTIGKKKYAEVQKDMEWILDQSEHLRLQLEQLIDDDTAAFNLVMQSLALPKETDEQRSRRAAALREATKAATDVPLRLLELCARGAELGLSVVEKGNRNSVSDAGVAVALFQAAALGASMNVRINLSGLDDGKFREAVTARMAQHLQRVDELAGKGIAFASERM